MIDKLDPSSTFMIFEIAAMREASAGRNGVAVALRAMAADPTDVTSAMIHAIVDVLLERERRLIDRVNKLIGALDTDIDAISPEIIENLATFLAQKYIERTR